MTLLAVVDAAVDVAGLEDLTLYRSEASIPFAGRYRLIDFALSNLVHSGVKSIGLFPSHPLVSLLDHIGMGKSWDLDRKKDGLFFLPPVDKLRGHHSVGSFAALAEHEKFFERSSQTHVVVTNCFTVCQMDYQDMYAAHLKSGADVTEAVSGGTRLRMYVLSKALLMDLIHRYKEERILSVEDLVELKKPVYSYSTYEYEGYYSIMDSMDSYFRESMRLLDEGRWKTLFLPDRPIMTKTKDEPPTQYLAESDVKRSLLANGCTVGGRVTNSILGRAVKVGRGAELEKCIFMQECEIGEYASLSYVVADKNVKIGPGVHLHGTADRPLVLRKGQSVMKEDVQ